MSMSLRAALFRLEAILSKVVGSTLHLRALRWALDQSVADLPATVASHATRARTNG